MAVNPNVEPAKALLLWGREQGLFLGHVRVGDVEIHVAGLASAGSAAAGTSDDDAPPSGGWEPRDEIEALAKERGLPPPPDLPEDDEP